MSLLGKYTRQNSYNRPAQKSTISCRITSVEERVFLLWMTMNITVYPDVSLFDLRKRFKELFDVVDLGLEIWIWIDPLSIKVHTCNWISVVTTDDTIGVQDWNQYESVELAKKFRLFSIWAQEVEHALKDCARWSLTWMNTRRDNYVWLSFKILGIPRDCYLPER